MDDSSFQIAVIGGGINGAGIAREAAYRGYKTLLVEQGDFAQGPSSQSSKLVHGGIRYLEQGRLGLVFEALAERRKLLAIAPHLVHPLRFHIPVYAEDSRPAWMIGLGCKLYDLLAGGQNLALSQRLPRREWAQFGELRQAGLRAIFAYSDAQVFDSRLTWETLLSAQQAGAQIRNYTQLSAARPERDHWRLELKDHRNGQTYEAQAQVVVNAAGAWAAELDRDFSYQPNRPGLRYSRGIHLVLDQEPPHGFLTLPTGGRVVFVLPWLGRTLIGTTESPYEGPPTADPKPSEEEQAYLLEVYNHYFPKAQAQPEAVRHVHSGLRCLVDRGEADLGKMSREAWVSGEQRPEGAGYWAVYGGKLTSYRALGEKVLSQIARSYSPQKTPSLRTDRDPLPGAKELPPERVAQARDDLTQAGLGPDQEACWKASYGARWVDLARFLRYTDAHEDLTGQGFFRAELRYLVQQEMAWELGDVTERRSLLAYDLTPQQTEALARALEQERRWSP